MYDIEKFYQAGDVDDAIRALSADESAIIISGGSDVLVQIREGRHAGCSLVSIHGIKELEGIKMEADGTIVIGAATTFSHVTNNEIIENNIPILGHALDQAGGPQLRNTGTIGGNFCNGVTSADSASSLMALNAVIGLKGSNGSRMVPISEWYTGPGKTVRAHDEVALNVRVAKSDYEGFGGHYIKYGKRSAMEIATLGCAVNVKLKNVVKKGDFDSYLSSEAIEDPDNYELPFDAEIEDIRIAYGVAAPTPIRCYETEKSVTGCVLSPEVFEKISEGVLSEVNPRSSWRASREFRLQLVSELSKRALKKACCDCVMHYW